MTFTPTHTDRLTGGRDGDASPSIFDFDPADVCPECFTVRAKNGSCACPQ